jgi:CubicO group peptidase (beta-lactamase class C family)
MRRYSSSGIHFEPAPIVSWSISSFQSWSSSELASGQPLETFLRERIFDPLQLRMVADSGQKVINGGARSYSRSGSRFEKVDGHIYALGPGGIWSTRPTWSGGPTTTGREMSEGQRC